MEDDVIRGATVTIRARSPSRRRRRKCSDCGAAEKGQAARTDARRKTAQEVAAFKAADQATGHSAGRRWRADAADRAFAPASFMQHFIVFVLAVLRRLPGDLGRRAFAAHAADGGHQRDFVDHHSGRTDADRVGHSSWCFLRRSRSLWPAINIFGGFLVTRRMLAMFQKS